MGVSAGGWAGHEGPYRPGTEGPATSSLHWSKGAWREASRELHSYCFHGKIFRHKLVFCNARSCRVKDCGVQPSARHWLSTVPCICFALSCNFTLLTLVVALLLQKPSKLRAALAATGHVPAPPRPPRAAAAAAISAEAVCNTLLSPKQWRVVQEDAGKEAPSEGPTSHPATRGSSPAPTQLPSGPRLDAHAVGSLGEDGSPRPRIGWLFPDAKLAERSQQLHHPPLLQPPSVQHEPGNIPLPTARVWLPGSGQHAILLPYFHGPLLLLLLLRDGTVVAPQLLEVLRGVLEQQVPGLAAQLSATQPPLSMQWHVQGHRYSVADADLGCTRCVGSGR